MEELIASLKNVDTDTLADYIASGFVSREYSPQAWAMYRSTILSRLLSFSDRAQEVPDDCLQFQSDMRD